MSALLLRLTAFLLPITILSLSAAPVAAAEQEPERKRAAFWVDLLLAEPLETEASLWEDLATVDVVFVGETHRLERHHALHEEILSHLLKAGRPLVLGMEQIEARNQPELDLLNRGDIDFDTFAERIRWKEQWQNCEDYREVVTAAVRGGARIVGLNAPREIVRQVGQTGLDALPPAQRSLLPERIHTDDPAYERLMNLLLSVHAAFDPSFLRHVFEAQVVRDDAMAAHLVAALAAARQTAGPKRPLGMVIAGAGHLQFGLGTPDRVSWRNPDLQCRILLLSESGDLVLTPTEEAMRRAIQIHHRDLVFIRRPVGDYLHVKEWNPKANQD